MFREKDKIAFSFFFSRRVKIKKRLFVNFLSVSLHGPSAEGNESSKWHHGIRNISKRPCSNMHSLFSLRCSSRVKLQKNIWFCFLFLGKCSTVILFTRTTDPQQREEKVEQNYCRMRKVRRRRKLKVGAGEFPNTFAPSLPKVVGGER